jgi:hypothetical protein
MVIIQVSLLHFYCLKVYIVRILLQLVLVPNFTIGFVTISKQFLSKTML